jgi:hypothetical protein
MKRIIALASPIIVAAAVCFSIAIYADNADGSVSDK